MSSHPTQHHDYPVNPRVTIAALWAAMLFVLLHVDLISMFRADVRADIEAGKVFASTIGPGVLLGMTVYVLIRRRHDPRRVTPDQNQVDPATKPVR